MPNPVPTELAEALTPEWLNFAICNRYPGAQVTGVTVLETIVTQATKVRFVVEYADAPADTPRNFCLKGLFGDHVAMARASGAMVAEARFYSEIASHVSMRLPTAVYHRISESGEDAVIVMLDVIETQGARFLTALNPYTVEQAAESLDQLARLHAFGSGPDVLKRLPWLTSRVEFFAHNPVMPVDRLDALMAGPRGDPLPPALRDGARQFAALKALVKRMPGHELTLVHGDCHAGNVYETASGPAFVDWQLLQRTSWALDLSYHIAAVLDQDTRENAQHHLITHYLECLRRAGGHAPPIEDVWREYRAYMAYGFHMWSITQKVDPEITNEFVRRLGDAVASLGTFDVLSV